MKLNKLGALLSLAAALTACDSNVEKAIKPYVESVIGLKADNGAGVVTLTGRIPFTYTEYFTNYRTECDRQVCGYDREQRCYTTERCTGSAPSCHTSTVCHTTSDSVCHTDSSGVEHCTSTPRRECEDVERCTGGGQVCRPDTVCHWEDVPRYCDVNCRQVPYQDSRVYDRSSAVTVKVSGVSGGKINDLAIGARTNSAYEGLFNTAVSKPKEIEDVLKTLSKDDKSLLVLKAEGLQLRGGQKFLELPPGFKAGDPVSVDVAVEPSGSQKKTWSALGSASNFPVLNESGQRP